MFHRVVLSKNGFYQQFNGVIIFCKTMHYDLEGRHTNILDIKLITIVFSLFVVFAIYVQVQNCRVTTSVHSVCRVPFTKVGLTM